jgi:hypothetical protein
MASLKLHAKVMPLGPLANYCTPKLLRFSHVLSLNCRGRIPRALTNESKYGPWVTIPSLEETPPFEPNSLLIRALAGSKVSIQLGNVFEHRHAREGFHDVENLLDLRLHVDERNLTAALLQLFTAVGKDTQSCAADEF